MSNPIFQNFLFGDTGIKAPNRIALAPMTNKQSHADGTLGEDEYQWLVSRAKHNFGVVFTCAVHVQEDGQGWEGELGNFDNIHLNGLTKLASGIKAHGSLAIMQLYHGGARSPQHLIGVQPWSASDTFFQLKDQQIPVRGATQQDIFTVIQSFITAALRAYHAGFDGVELHAAHGYLLHQFLSTFTNTRTDKWGGHLENRARILTDILKGIRQHVPQNFLVGIRISPEDKFDYRGINFDDSLALSELLIANGADFLDISTWDSKKKPDKYPNIEKPIITWLREKLGDAVPLFVAGKIWTPQDALDAIQAGADFVALGKVAIGNPTWPSIAQNMTNDILFPPYTTVHLQQAGLGTDFINYMKKWENFVSK